MVFSKAQLAEIIGTMLPCDQDSFLKNNYAPLIAYIEKNSIPQRNTSNSIDAKPFVNSDYQTIMNRVRSNLRPPKINMIIVRELKGSDIYNLQIAGDKKGLEKIRRAIKAELKRWFLPYAFKIGYNELLLNVNEILASDVFKILHTIKTANLSTAESEYNKLYNQCQGMPNQVLSAAGKILTDRSDYRRRAIRQKLNLHNKKPKQPVTQSSTLPCANDVNTTTNALPSQNTILDNPQSIEKLDGLDMVSTTACNHIFTIPSESNQRITKILNTLNDQSLEAFSNKINTLTELLRNKQVSAGYQDKFFAVGLEASALLQQYTENSSKRIVGQQDINKNIFNARKDALTSVSNNPTECSEEFYTLNPDICTTLKSYGINPTSYTYCLGNAVQQQFHTEVVTMLNEMVNIPLNASTQPFLDVVITCTHAGNVYAQENNIEKAFSLADCAWAALDCANIGVENGIDLTQKTNIDRDIEIAKGIIDGLHSAVLNTTNMVLDPVGTISNVGVALGHFTLCLMDIASLTEDDFLTFNLDSSKHIEENAQKRREKIDSIIDAVNKTTLKERTVFVTEQIVSCLIMDLGISAIKHCAKSSAIPLAKLGKVITDNAPNKIPKVFSAIRQEITDTLGNFTKAEHVTVTAEGVKVSVTAQKEAQVSQSMKK